MDEKPEGAREARLQRALDHSGRAAILEVLKDEGGELTAEEIQSQLPMSLTLARIEYHLRVLAAHGLVVQRGSSYGSP
ncbi:MAG: winged helix-turn-helix domain-containing protein [Solirubrobacterales bacterium]